MPSELNELSSKDFSKLENRENKVAALGKFLATIVGRALPLCGKIIHNPGVTMPGANA